MTKGNTLSCRLLGCRSDTGDDEDDEDDGIERMALCYTDWRLRKEKCENGSGDTLSFTGTPMVGLDLTVHLKRGDTIRTTVDLQKIVKPRSPQVWNVTFNHESNQAVILIRTPYHKDYLKVDNQLFQLHICTAGSEMVLFDQNISSSDILRIDMERLQKNTEYQVRVRAIPHKFLQGSWSEWSESFSFFTPAEGKVPEEGADRQVVLYISALCLFFVVTSAVVLCKNKVFTYMWPSIPHPKHTLVQICRPSKGLLLHFHPEVFSTLKVFPMEKPEEQLWEETDPPTGPAVADGSQPNDPCSTQSSDCRSTTTEELELSALLSRSSSDGEESLQSTSLSPASVLQLEDRDTPPPEHSRGGNEAEVFGVSQQEEAYVTMSSFYQIK
nr:interleukin-7 receptor subunit alpha isoform X3 [Monopterus albus]XP_020478108.1 interleukin-7 receptor subunit alpha isoform X3 [Monopterus albus]XP_020478109.1 interleukin-7 receptor subunit alpha isoform X3 [Monopterus albus]XP_020478110.1 interleukin-7 receptor subunit alpha isoform X3 [Monopterus albus]